MVRTLTISTVVRLSVFLLISGFLIACEPYGTTSSGNGNPTHVAMTVQAALHTPGPKGGIVPVGTAQNSPVQPADPGGNTGQGGPTPTRIPTKPAPAPQPNQPISQINISGLGSYPENIVYFGFCSAGELTQLGVHATIDPLDEIQDATLKYSWVDPNGMTFDGSTQMWLLGVGDYEGVIDAEVEGPLTLGDHDGVLEYWVEVKDKQNNIMQSNLHSISVGFCPGAVAQPGGQPSIANQPPVAGQPPAINQPPVVGAGPNTILGTVKFVNNSSHPIVSLIIDNQEVILSEQQAILQAGWLEVSGLGPGNHAYAATNGFWSGGSPQILLPLPVGSFSGAPPQVTINDPTIYELLTNYTNQGAFVGEYWDQNVNFHYAGLCFYSNGSVDVYYDGQFNGNTTYSLVDRQPGAYSVTFQLGQFSGTYYYAGAAAGDMQVNNGPSNWKDIDYMRDLQCP